MKVFNDNAVLNFLQRIDFYDLKILTSNYEKILSLKINSLEKQVKHHVK